MGTAGHFSTLGLAVTASLLTSTTPEPPHLSQPPPQASNPLSSDERSSERSEDPLSFIEPTVVTITEHPLKHPVALDQVPRGRDAIGRLLQKELRRVGCYSGELNGEWTMSTRRAMKDFIERVNATLPIDQPDGILLALVQGHPGKVCGVPCPAGEGLSRDALCVPSAILAMTGRTKIAVTTKKSTPTIAGVAPSTSHPGDVALVDAAPAAATTAPGPTTRRRIAQKNWRPPSVRRERNWASALFRFSFN